MLPDVDWVCGGVGLCSSQALEVLDISLDDLAGSAINFDFDVLGIESVTLDSQDLTASLEAICCANRVNLSDGLGLVALCIVI